MEWMPEEKVKSCGCDCLREAGLKTTACQLRHLYFCNSTTFDIYGMRILLIWLQMKKRRYIHNEYGEWKLFRKAITLLIFEVV